jgi:hypothetical protein
MRFQVIRLENLLIDPELDQIQLAGLLGGYSDGINP